MANIILNKINSLDILKNYITDASATITGIEITDKTDDWAASSLPRAASLSYFAAYIAVFVAVGAAAEIVIATSKSPLTLKSLNKSNIQTGIKTSLKNETKYNSFFLIRFLKFELARNESVGLILK